MVNISKIMKDFTLVFLERVLAGKIIVTMGSVKKFIGRMSSFIISSFHGEKGLGQTFKRQPYPGPGL